MRTDRELMQQARDALTDFFNAYPHMAKGYTEDAIATLSERLKRSEYDLWKEHPYTKAFMKGLEIERGHPAVTTYLGGGGPSQDEVALLNKHWEVECEARVRAER